MRKTLLLCLLSLPCFVAAHASTIDDFVLTGDSYVLTYSLPATSIVSSDELYGYIVETAPTTINGVPDNPETILYFDTRIYPSISLTVPIPNTISGINLLGPTFIDFEYTYPSTSPGRTVTTTFLPGTYTFEELTLNQQPVTPLDYFTLTITPETTPVPEPSSLSLLATGAASLLAFARTWRRKRIQQA